MKPHTNIMKEALIDPYFSMNKKTFSEKLGDLLCITQLWGMKGLEPRLSDLSQASTLQHSQTHCLNKLYIIHSI